NNITTVAKGTLWNAALAATEDRKYFLSGTVLNRTFATHMASGNGVHNPFLLEALLTSSIASLHSTYGLPSPHVDLRVQATLAPTSPNHQLDQDTTARRADRRGRGSRGARHRCRRVWHGQLELHAARQRVLHRLPHHEGPIPAIHGLEARLAELPRLSSTIDLRERATALSLGCRPSPADLDARQSADARLRRLPRAGRQGKRKVEA